MKQCAVIGILLASLFLFGCAEKTGTTITNFEECVAAGNPVMESYPRQCSADGQTFVEQLDEMPSEISSEEAIAIAKESVCTEQGELKEFTASYNSNTKTWWIDLDIEKEGCNPACVVWEENKTAEINWRCTGLIMPE